MLHKVFVIIFVSILYHMHSMHFIGGQDFDTFMWLDFVLDQSRHMKQRRVGYRIGCTSCQPGMSIVTVRLIMQQVWLARE